MDRGQHVVVAVAPAITSWCTSLVSKACLYPIDRAIVVLQTEGVDFARGSRDAARARPFCSVFDCLRWTSSELGARAHWRGFGVAAAVRCGAHRFGATFVFPSKERQEFSGCVTF